MVTPLIGEAEWTPLLRSVRPWQPTSAPMLIVVPHPDDETLAAGGLIASQRARGVDITIVAVTDGEHAYTDNHGLAALRREEQTAALARLGVPRDKIIRLGLTDSSVSHQENNLIAALQPLVTAQTQILAPWHGDFHPDHEACARSAKAVSNATGATLISYFFWTWHRGTPATIDGLTLASFPLTEAALTAKLEALTCHASQLHHAPEPEILPDNLLWPARLPFEIFAL
jgi:LmbE family N-acetylglucosaminyl deacetylase